MRKPLEKCEICEEMHVLNDGVCKKCGKALDQMISISTLILCGLQFFIPYTVGMNTLNATLKRNE